MNEINKKLLAHIFNDAYILGSFDLEFILLSHSIQYFRKYFTQLTSVPHGLTDLVNKFTKLSEYEQGLSYVASEKELETQCQVIRADIDNLAPGQDILLPAGWSEHGMIYQFKKDKTGQLFFSIYNTGCGINIYHTQCFKNNQEAYHVLTYQFQNQNDINKDNDLFSHLLPMLMRPLTGCCRCNNEDNEKYLYETCFRLIGEKVYDPRTVEAQISGTCAQRCLEAMLKAQFTTEDEYTQFMYDFRQYALNDYWGILKKTPSCEQGDLAQLKKACLQQLSMLHGMSNFVVTKIDNDREAIRSILDWIEPQVLSVLPAKNQINQAAHKEISIQFEKTNQVIDQYQSTTTINDLKAKCSAETLQADLDELKKRCLAYSYSVDNKKLACIMLIEDLFFNLPLETQFYDSINNHDTALRFFECLTALQYEYYTACRSKFGTNAMFPRMLHLKLNACAIIDIVDRKINHSLPFTNVVNQVWVKRFLGCTPENAYLAMHNPRLDQRLEVIRQQFNQQVVHDDILNFYKQLLALYKDKKTSLEDCYNACPLDEYRRNKKYHDCKDQWFQKIREAELHGLFHLLIKQPELKKGFEYKIICQKFELLYAIECCYAKGFCEQNSEQLLARHWNSSNPDHIELLSPLQCAIKGSTAHIEEVKSWKYASKNTPCLDPHLIRAYGHLEYQDYPKSKESNRIQLFSYTILSGKPSWSFSSTVNTDIIEQRLLFSLKINPSQQLIETLECFSQSAQLAYLSSHEALYGYIEANLFQPGLIIAELKEKSAQFFKTVKWFVHQGLEANKHSDCIQLTQKSLPFMRLYCMIMRYCHEQDSNLAQQAYDDCLAKLNESIQVTQDRDVRASLHRYRFELCMSNRNNQSKQMDALLNSYFILNINQNRHEWQDPDSLVRTDCDKEVFSNWLLENKDSVTVEHIETILTSLSLQQLDGTMIKKDKNLIFHVYRNNDRIYTVNAASGLVFNNKNLALTTTPLNIKNHVLFTGRNLCTKQCFISWDQRTISVELPTETIYFSRYSSDSKWMIQRGLNAGKSLYQLYATSSEQAMYLSCISSVRNENLPSVLQERDQLYWLNVRDQTAFEITDLDRTSHYLGKKALDEWQISTVEGDRVLFNDDILSRTAAFESARLTIVTEKTIQFPRYQLMLEREESVIQLNWRHRKLRLLDQPIQLGVGIASLTFQDDMGMILLMPVQPFIPENACSPVSEYYHLKQDIDAEWFEEANRTNEIPIQYSCTAQYLIFEVQDGHPVARTCAEKLFLSYVYLGSYQFDRALEWLKACREGITGANEEWCYINLILKSLPQLLQNSPKKSCPLPPEVVVCQLMVLNLMVGYQLQEKQLPVEIRNDIKRLFDLYLRMQQQYALTATWMLEASIRKQLLDYYHRCKMHPAMGTLGREWLELSLKNLYCFDHNVMPTDLYFFENASSVKKVNDYHNDFTFGDSDGTYSSSRSMITGNNLSKKRKVTEDCLIGLTSTDRRKSAMSANLLRTINCQFDSFSVIEHDPQILHDYPQSIWQALKVDVTEISIDELLPPTSTASNTLNLSDIKGALDKFEKASGVAKYQALELVKQSVLNVSWDQIQLPNLSCEKEEQELINFAHQGPEEELAHARWCTQRMARAEKTIDLKQLLILYFKNNQQQYLDATQLSVEKIKQLHQNIAVYLQKKLQQQQYARGQKLLTEWQNALEKEQPEIAVRLAKCLCAENLVNITTEPALAVLQHEADILLHPAQKAAIQRLLSSQETIEQVLMGGGKSKVIAPAFSKLQANGYNLVVIEVPSALLYANYKDLQETSDKLFKQKAISFKFNRESDCSVERLKALDVQWKDTIVDGNYLVTTGESVQSLDLKYFELLGKKPSKESAYADWEKQVLGVETLLKHFSERAVVLIDEVHQGLQIKKKLNYTVGEKTYLPVSVIIHLVALYQCFENVWIDGPHDITLLSAIQKKQEFSEEGLKQVLTDLVKVLASRLIVETKQLDATVDELEGYLLDQSIPDWIHKAPQNLQEKLAIYKEQVNVLLPYTLRRKYKEHYGPSAEMKKEVAAQVCAIPYLANNIPNERSRFGNVLETANDTIQSLLIDGVPEDLLAETLEQWKTSAAQTYANNKTRYSSCDETPIAKLFSELCPQQCLSKINLKDEATLKDLSEALHKHQMFIFEVLKTVVLPNIETDTSILHHDAYNHVDIFKKCHGMSGTPWNHSTFHQRLAFQEETHTNEYVVETLKAKNPKIHPIQFKETQTYIEDIFSHDAEQSIQAMIDVSASFKGIANLDVARCLATVLQKQKRDAIKYVLYFDTEKRLSALSVADPEAAPIVIGNTDESFIVEQLKVGPEQRFTFYDQARTLGTDIKQSPAAKAVVMIDADTSIQQFTQGCMRMRALLEGMQSVEVVVPNVLREQQFNTLCQGMTKKLEQQLQVDNFHAALAQMENCIRSDLKKRLFAAQTVDEKEALYQKVQEFFITQNKLDWVKQYGAIRQDRSTADIFNEKKKWLLDAWQRLALQSEEEIIAMNNQLSEIVTRYSQEGMCAQMQRAGTQEMSQAVETQKEMQHEVELEKEQHVETQKLTQASHTKNAYLTPELLNKRYDVSFFDNNLQVSKNYYETYENQKNYLNAYTKPIQALLWTHLAKDQYSCVLLSADEVNEVVLKNNQWLGTTHHAVHRGKPPQGYQDKVAYQRLVEQVRYLQGTFDLIINQVEPIHWFSENFTEKSAFFKKKLAHSMLYSASQLEACEARFGIRQTAYAYIVKYAHPSLEKVNWDTVLNVDVAEADQDSFNALIRACALANQLTFSENKNELDQTAWQADFGLDLQAYSYLLTYINNCKSDQALYLSQNLSWTNAKNLLNRYPAMALDSKAKLLRLGLEKVVELNAVQLGEVVALSQTDKAMHTAVLERKDLSFNQLKQLIQYSQTQKTVLKTVQHESMILDHISVMTLLERCENKALGAEHVQAFFNNIDFKMNKTALEPFLKKMSEKMAPTQDCYQALVSGMKPDTIELDEWISLDETPPWVLQYVMRLNDLDVAVLRAVAKKTEDLDITQELIQRTIDETVWNALLERTIDARIKQPIYEQFEKEYQENCRELCAKATNIKTELHAIKSYEQGKQCIQENLDKSLNKQLDIFLNFVQELDKKSDALSDKHCNAQTALRRLSQELNSKAAEFFSRNRDSVTTPELFYEECKTLIHNKVQQGGLDNHRGRPYPFGVIFAVLHRMLVWIKQLFKGDTRSYRFWDSRTDSKRITDNLLLEMESILMA